VLLLLADGTQVPVTELPGAGPWTFLVLQPDPAPGALARSLTRLGRAVVPDLRARPGWGQGPDAPHLLDLVDDLDQVRTRAGLGRPVLVGLGDLAPTAQRAATDQPWAWRALVLAPGPPAPSPRARDAPAPDTAARDAVAPDVVAPDAMGPNAPAPDALAPGTPTPDAPQPKPPDAGAPAREGSPGPGSERGAVHSPGTDGLELPVLVLDAEADSEAAVAAVGRLLAGLGGGPGWAGIAPDAPPR
jgi:pimeloyl-ACP methyl ester carboxylesterase